MIKKITLSILSCSLLLVVEAQNDDKLLTEETVKKNTIEGHIYFLASDEMKGRANGSPEIDIAAQYLASAFRVYGLKPIPGANGYFQNINLSKKGSLPSVSFKLGENEVNAHNNLLMLNGDNTKVAAESIHLGYGLAQDYLGKEVQGKIVLVQAGEKGSLDLPSLLSLRTQKLKLAKEHGAVGLVELVELDDQKWGQIRNNFPSLIKAKDNAILPYLWLRTDDKQLKKRFSSAKGKESSIEVKSLDRLLFNAKNVVGMVEGTDPKLKNEFVIYSAHYDHIGVGKPNAEGDSIYNGARDNAVGTVTVLSAAENIAKYPTKRSALFILFTAEERGLLGSKWYANHPLIPLEQMVYCFNSDNGGYNDTSIATIVGLERTTANLHVKEACTTFGLIAKDAPPAAQGLFDRSDNVSFAAKGIPAPTFSLGFTAFDQEIMKYYHKQADNPDNLDYDYLTKFFKAYVLACRLIANDKNTPFWVEGDKYYNAGKKLYGK